MSTVPNHLVKGKIHLYADIDFDSGERQHEYFTVDHMRATPALSLSLEQTTKDGHVCGARACISLLGLVLVLDFPIESGINHVYVASCAWNLVWSCGLVRNTYVALREVLHRRD